MELILYEQNRCKQVKQYMIFQKGWISPMKAFDTLIPGHCHQFGSNKLLQKVS